MFCGRKSRRDRVALAGIALLCAVGIGCSASNRPLGAPTLAHKNQTRSREPERKTQTQVSDLAGLQQTIPSQVLAADASCGGLAQRIAQRYAMTNWTSHYAVIPGPCPPSAPPRGGGFGPGPTAPRHGPPRLHFTGTNNQVQGIEESDAIVTDGQRLYLATAREVRIVRLLPPTGLIARIPLSKGFQARRLLVSGARLVVFAESGHGADGVRSQVTVYDLRRPKRPRITRQWEFDGHLLAERGLGPRALLVLHGPLTAAIAALRRINAAQRKAGKLLGHVQVPCCGRRPGQFRSQQQAVEAWALKQLAGLKVAQLLPQVRFSQGPGLGAKGTMASKEQPLVACRDLHGVGPAGRYRSANLVSVVSLDLATGELRSSGVVDAAQTVYVSPRSVYVTRQKVNASGGGQSCSGVPRPINFGAPPLRVQTVLHRFALDQRTGRPRYRATTELPGDLLNAFALDEHRGHLRVATTSLQNGPGTSPRQPRAPWTTHFVSNLLVLRVAGKKLQLVGALRNLAPGERIFAVRYQGDRGYLVTFPAPVQRVRIDPFFTLDLSNPKQPRVSGELKIPGWSNYLHPFGATSLLAVGQDADRAGRARGVHLQIFDASAARRPLRTAHYRLTRGPGSSSSRAQLDHHAFLFDPITKLLSLPLSVPAAGWAGAVVLTADPKRGFGYLGTVHHGDLVPKTTCAEAAHKCSRYAPVTRSFVLGSNLVTVSRFGIKVHRYADLALVASLRLP